MSKLGEELGNRAVRREGIEFREGYVASQFAKHLNADAVRLLRPGSNVTPDFAVQLTGSEYRYETTEADMPGRKRGEEYSDRIQFETVRHIPDDEWIEASAYFSVVRSRAMSKASKVYVPCQGLILWSNAFPIRQEETLTANWWKQALEPASVRFPEVWCYFRKQFRRIY